jgi:hypothetical protein
MKALPELAGLIERRILVNFAIDPQVLAAALPSPFEPLTVDGWGMAGICLIRLARVRPRLVSLPVGLCSENAAHRVAVKWTEAGREARGVYIPRRDTDNLLNSLAGGRLFPGEHHRARFECEETADAYSVEMHSLDGQVEVAVRGTVADGLPPQSVFESVAAASAFFEEGSLGYSDRESGGCFDGLELRCEGWKVWPLHVSQVHSSYFSDPSRFPPGSVRFDHALLMRDIPHTWIARDPLKATEA